VLPLPPVLVLVKPMLPLLLLLVIQPLMLVDQQLTQELPRPVVVKLLPLVTVLPVLIVVVLLPVVVKVVVSVLVKVEVVSVLVTDLPKAALFLNVKIKRLVSLQVL
jgi:hypothetical protein